MPCNLYGEGDNYDLKGSHVLPALTRKMTEARLLGINECCLWGTGIARREFLISDDCAEACVHVMNLSEKDLQPILSGDTAPIFNVGSGEEITIAELAQMVASIVGYQGRLWFDSHVPDGTPRKVLDSSRIRHLGWLPRTALIDGVRRTYASVRLVLEGLVTLPVFHDVVACAKDDAAGIHNAPNGVVERVRGH
jgi:GDP-L-fucose synthase